LADQLEEFIDRLRETHANNLSSVVLYGSAAAREQLKRDEPKNLLVVLERITPADLKSANSLAEDWRLKGNPLPVYFTLREIQDSADVFPIEFLDMSRVRHVLYGEDPFEVITIDTHNLRHQLEYELRGKLIRLRTLYIPASRNSNRLAALMADSLESFTVLFRHALPMLGAEAPVDKRDCAIAMARNLRLDESVFKRIFEYARDEEVWLESETNKTFELYLRQIECVVEAVDKKSES
jgi:hypothetical protein